MRSQGTPTNSVTVSTLRTPNLLQSETEKQDSKEKDSKLDTSRSHDSDGGESSDEFHDCGEPTEFDEGNVCVMCFIFGMMSSGDDASSAW